MEFVLTRLLSSLGCESTGSKLDEKKDILQTNIKKPFDLGIKEFYSEQDFSAGYIKTKNRSGLEELFPIMTISVVGVRARNHKDIYSLEKEAGKLKKICKQTPGSCRKLV